MKACKNCKFPSVQVELSTVIRSYAILDTFRFLFLLGPMLSMFYACTNIYPMPKRETKDSQEHEFMQDEFILYYGNRSELCRTELHMLDNIEKSCSREYRDNLPAIWAVAEPTLRKALYLQGIAMVLPATSAIAFLTFQKKDIISSLLAVNHFLFEIISSILGIYGAYFFSDVRLCFLGNFSETLHIPILLWTLNILFAILYKIGILYSLELYIRLYWKAKTFKNESPTPSEELKSYLQELKALGVTPKVNFDIPEDPSKRDWVYVRTTIKKLLHDVRIQMAELHRDDPVVDNILKSGKLQEEEKEGQHHHHHHHRKSGSGTAFETGGGPSVLKIAKMMASKNSEYTLLKQHQHHHGKGEVQGNKDDVEIILPEPNLRFDKDFK